MRSSESMTRLIPWLMLLSYNLLYDLIWLRYSSRTRTSKRPLCLQSIVICLIISSKHWSYSSYLIGHMPTSLACFWINLLSNYYCSWMTSILVAGVDSTVCTHSCPLSVRCYLGGKISPRMSSVWCAYYYFFVFFACTALPALTSTGVEYLTNEPWSPNISYIIVANSKMIVRNYVYNINSNHPFLTALSGNDLMKGYLSLWWRYNSPLPS